MTNALVTALESLEPTAMAALRTALGVMAPAAAAVENIMLDAVQTLIVAHNPAVLTPPANSTVPAPVILSAPVLADDTLAGAFERIAALEAHVAALTISTRQSTSVVMQTNKADVLAIQAANAKAAAASDSSVVAVQKKAN